MEEEQVVSKNAAADESGRSQINNYHFHAPISAFNQHVDIIELFATYDPNKATADEDGDEEEEGAEATDVERKLLGAFYGDLKNVREYLREVRSCERPMQIVRFTGEMMRAGRISRLSVGREMWDVLHNAGIYTASKQNWLIRIRNEM